MERYSIGRFDYDGLYTVIPTHNDAQYEGLRKLVDEKKGQATMHEFTLTNF